MHRLVSSWPCDYVNTFDWIHPSSGLLKATQAKVPFLDAFFWTSDNWWKTHLSRFLPFSPSSMLIDHIIITFLLMVVGCDGWEGCKSISRGLFVANIQPTNRPACLSNIKWVVRSEVDYHYRDFYHPVKCQMRCQVKISDITIFASPVLSYLWKFWPITDLAKYHLAAPERKLS